MTQSRTIATNLYGAIATEIYDIDKPLGTFADTAFYLEALTGIEGPILEPACGSGRMLIPLMEAGHDITGFDASAQMLAACAARCAERGLTPRLSRQRYEDFAYEQSFAAIVLPAGSFGLIGSFAVALGALRRFAAHLRPGGRLVIDVQPLSALAARGDDLRAWAAGNGDLLTCEGRVVAVDWMAQTIQRRYRYERWRDGELVGSEIDPMVLRHWGREEFAMALDACGFGDVAVSGNHDRRRPPRSSDHSLTFQAIKAG